MPPDYDQVRLHKFRGAADNLRNLAITDDDIGVRAGLLLEYIYLLSGVAVQSQSPSWR